MRKRQWKGIPMVPFGLISCLADDQEVRVTELAEEGFTFRTAEELGGNPRLFLHFFNFRESRYEEVELTQFELEKESQTKFFTEYVVNICQDIYLHNVRKLIRDYGEYINLKLEGDDAWMSSERVGYPAELEDEHYETFEQQKRAWFKEKTGISLNKSADEAERAQSWEFLEQVELAVELDTPWYYEQYLALDIQTFMASYWKENFLSEHPLSRKKVDRIYIGNQFCHCLFPKKEALSAMMDKAKQEGLEITIALTYVRDFMLEEVGKLLEYVDKWCRTNDRNVEILVNDWAVPALLKGKENLIPRLGILLNKRRKDVRCEYKKGFYNSFNEETSSFEKNNLNSDFYREFLEENLGIQGFEFESCSFWQKLPDGKHSLHLPFFQTNTSQYCTLYAQCRNGERGRQEMPWDCPFYCQEQAFLYPKHLHMVGRYNSLFGYDEKILWDASLIAGYIRQGVERLVVNLL